MKYMRTLMVIYIRIGYNHVKQYLAASACSARGFVSVSLILLQLPVFMWAEPLNFSPEESLDLAQRWQRSHADIYTSQITALKNIQELRVAGELVAQILFPAQGGYLICSASDETRPLIAVSETYRGRQFAPDHPLLRLVKYDLPNRIYRSEHNPNESVEHALEWDSLLHGEQTTVAQLDTIIYNPTPTWGQGWTAGAMVFNLYTPNHWSTGCVATALAEILTYYHWPPRGTGSNSYWDNGVNLSVNYNDYTYDWANTLDDYTNTFSTPAQKEAAGLLSYHTAVSVNMDFESTGSTANTADGPMALHYHFQSSGHYTSSTASGYLSQVIANLEDGRPVAFALNGAVDHAGVGDGYAGQYGLVHMNYGWDGDSNGWYDITGAFLPGYNYTIIGALKGVVPNPMLSDDIQWLDGANFVLSWLTSPRLNADYFQLQQKLGSGNWVTLESALADTSRTIHVASPGTYSYRVRAHRDAIWWDWSRVKTISIGNNVTVEFIIDMQERPLLENEELVLLGNIAPLGNVQNSPAFSYQSNGIYSTEVTFENSYVGDSLAYRFGVTGPSYQDIESFNRVYQLTALAYQSLDTVRFDHPLALTEHELRPLDGFQLGRAYPNPFNSQLSIPLEIYQAGNYTLQVYDIRGRRVGAAVPYHFTTGSHLAHLDLGAANLASGIYLVQVRSGQSMKFIKCQLLK